MNQRFKFCLLVMASCIGVGIVVAPTARGAAEDDHLAGDQVKDQQKIQPAGTQTLTNLFGSQNCTLKKAKFFLVHSAKNGGDDPRGGPAGDFVCYQAKCTGALPPATTVDDQFATHTLTSKKAKLVCVPANPHVCGDGNLDPGEACDPAGSTTQCPGALSCNSDCTCPACPGQLVGGSCWLFGGDGESCDTVCAHAALSCAPATVTYAGGGGTDSQCTAVADALSPSTPFLGPQNCGTGLGCAASAGFAARCQSPTTTCSDGAMGTQRFCACQ